MEEVVEANVKGVVVLELMADKGGGGIVMAEVMFDMLNCSKFESSQVSILRAPMVHDVESSSCFLR